ncbi:melanoma-associated antigen E1-like [Trachemys scripta elegans]|uniref:melanoma-associated antigen E1-like n=1 Tax=Trachemys scripta elegans TaxID=31138 RepID=UPI0015528EF5|nr:melanoma-associated antigen E1-like [Trachemys scripta elegans]
MKGTSIASFLLLALAVPWNVENRVEGQPKAPVKCKKLCTEFSQKRIPQKLLKTYRKTEPSCPKAAIIFVTQKNKEFCADPEASWVKEAVRQLNQASAPLNLPLSSTVTSAVVGKGPGVFHRLVGGTVSKPTQPSVPANPIHGAGTPGSTKSFSALQETVTPSTIHPEPVVNGSEVSMRSITTPAVDVPDSTSSRFHSVPTPVMKSSESFVESRNKSTGSISPTTDISGTAPRRFNSDPTPVIKGFESPIRPTYNSVSSTRNQTADGLASAPSRLISDAPSILNGRAIVKLSPTFLTTPSLLESVPSKPVIGLASMGQVIENSTMKPTAVLKGSDATQGSTPPGGESSSVSPNSGGERDAVSESTADARTGSYLSPLGKKDPPRSFPESVSPTEMSVLSFKSLMKPTAVLKGSDATRGSTPHPTSPGGESSSVSPNSGGERDAVSDSTADARTSSYLSPLGKKDPPRSFPESVSPTEMSVLSFKSLMKPTAVLKGSDATQGSTPHPTSPGGESSSVSPNSGGERDAVSDSMADARTGSYLSPLGKKDLPRCFPESVSPTETSVLSFKSFPLQNRAEGPSDGPLVFSILPASRTHILRLALLASVLGICSAAVWMYMYLKVKGCPGDSTKETVQGLLFNQQGSRTNEYAMEVI